MSLVEFKNVYKQYEEKGEKVDALKETSFSLEGGEFVAIIGPSGSGKSTLLTLMGGLQKPSGGNIIIDGIDIGSLNEKEREMIRFDKIGFVLQQSNLIPYLTLSQQLKLVNKIEKKKFDKNKAKELLESLGIEKYYKKYPQDLSGGEKQRAAIARALYPDPVIVLADEPTASLDSERAFEVVKLLAEETKKRQKVTVMVTHDERLIEYCDRVFVIVDGVLTERNKNMIE